MTHMPAARFKAAQNLMKQRLVRADDKEEKKKEDKSIFELAWEDNFGGEDDHGENDQQEQNAGWLHDAVEEEKRKF